MVNRINHRLQKLEQANGSDELSLDAQRLLVSLLGRFDSLWWPFRTHTGSYRGEVRRLQREYLAGVGGLRAAGQGETSWKSAHFSRNELIAAKLVQPLLSGGQVVSLRLTAQGIADGRAMVGDRLQTLDNQVTQLALIMLTSTPGWMIENELFGDEIIVGDNPTAWDRVTEHVLPLLACGAVIANSDLWCRVYYQAVDGVVLPNEPAATMTEQPWADRLYLDSFDSERSALQRLDCLDGGLVIPIPCTK